MFLQHAVVQMNKCKSILAADISHLKIKLTPLESRRQQALAHTVDRGETLGHPATTPCR